MIKIKERLVKDLMIPLEQYSKVSPEDTISQAVKVIVNSYQLQGLHYRTVLVVSDKKLVGLLTMRNLLAALDPALFDEQYLDYNYWNQSVSEAVELFALDELFIDRCRKNCHKKVKEIMKPLELITIDQNATLLRAIHLMVKNNINSLPVMDKDNVVGIIRVNEIVEEVYNLISDLPECHS